MRTPYSESSVPVVVLSWLLLAGPTQAASAPFTVQGIDYQLEDVSDQVSVLYRSLRLNRAANVWNVDLVLTNHSASGVGGPLLAVVEQATGTSGVTDSDGTDGETPPRPFWEMTDRAPDRKLMRTERTEPRTVTFGYLGGAAPQLMLRVFGRVLEQETLVQSRSLNELGQPLPAVTVSETGPGGTESFSTDPAFGVTALGQGAGTHQWTFTVPGYLPAWRAADLPLEQGQTLSAPKMIERSAEVTTLSSLDSAELGGADAGVICRFPPGTFGQPGTGTLTPLSAQTLSAPLPLGWSPLQAFSLELSTEPALAGEAIMVLWDKVSTAEQVALVRWDTNQFGWTVEALVAGQGSTELALDVTKSGVYAVVTGDPAPTSPPTPEPGERLLGSSVVVPDAALLVGEGSVDPLSSPASVVPEMVRAEGEVVVAYATGSLPSGLLLQGRVEESYQLADGSNRNPPVYPTHFVAYQRPGDDDPATLHARFPLQPMLLFGPDELEQATLRVEVDLPTPFAGGIVGPGGGEVAVSGIWLTAGVGTFARPQPVALSLLEPAEFATLVDPIEYSVVRAFTVMMGSTEPGTTVLVQFTDLPPDGEFVVARVVSERGLYGLEPRERLGSDARGRLLSREPSDEVRLPGLTTAGQYLLLQTAEPQGLITGVARNGQGEPAEGLAVRSFPWLTFSESAGQWQLLAPAGETQIEVRDLTTGDAGGAALTIADPSVPTQVNLEVTMSGPRVLSLLPTDGESGVSLVSPIEIEFDEPVQPGSVALDGILLLGEGDTTVEITISLSLDNRTITVLPLHPLRSATAHRLLLADTIVDRAGAPLEGPRAFSFTTESDALARRATAQVESYEPVDGIAAMVGAPGTAEPEAPVILVNETTGQTATTLSQVDGSFSNSIPAHVDDLLSAVIVNGNGTRNAIPVSRQYFADGRVGLFEGGGEVEIELPQGMTRISVEPGAISQKTVFKVEAVELQTILTLMSNTPPEDATLMRALQVEIEGDELSEPADISFEMDLEELGLQPGETAADRTFLIVEPIEAEGVPVYHIVDTASYENGRVTTHSPPFAGLLPTPATSFLLTCAMLPTYTHQTLVVGGAVVAVPASLARTLTPQDIINALSPGGATPNVRRVPGAIVNAYPVALAGSLVTARPGLVPGAFVSKANSGGHYAVWLRYDSFHEEGVALIARSDRLPNRIGSRGIGVNAGSLGYGVNIVIPVPENASGSLDQTPPLISADPPLASLPVGENVEIPILLRDDWSEPELTLVAFDPGHSVTTQTGDPLAASSVATPTPLTPVLVSPTVVRVPVMFRVDEPALASFRVTAQDQDGNVRDTLVPLRFGPPPDTPVGLITPHNPADDIGPQVVSATPENGVILQMGDPIRLRFNEALSTSITNGLGLDLTPAGSTLQVLLSPDQQTATIIPTNLEPDTDYTLTLDALVEDLVGNGLDQDPESAGLDPFELKFRTPVLEPRDLSGVLRPAGTVTLGNYALTLDRNDGALNGSLRVHRLDPTSSHPLISVGLPPFPRAMTLIPNYAFKRRPDPMGGETEVETKPLLVVVGGLIGPGTWLGQWIRVVDVSNPADPKRLATAYLTSDPTAVASTVKFNGSKIVVHLVTTEGPLLQFINLQALILGDHYTEDDWEDVGVNYFAGVDANGDGDFVDKAEGDSLPRPTKHSVWGLEWVLPLHPRSLLTDFDVTGSGGFVVGTLLDRLQVITFQGLPVGMGDPANTTGALVLPGTRLNRVLLDLDFPYTDGTGTTHIPVAVAAGDGYLHLIRLTDPTHPVLLNRVKLGDAVGSIRSLVRSGPDEYSVGATSGIYVVRRSDMDLPEIPNEIHESVLYRVGLAVAHRSMGASSMFFATSGGGGQWVLRPPLLSIVQIPTQPVTNIVALVTDEDAVRTYLDAMQEAPFLLPTLVAPFSPDCPSGLTPPNPELHHYALVQALGDQGETLRLSVESLELSGSTTVPKGLLYPPVHLTDKTTALRLQNAQPDVTAVIGYRLSTNPVSELYNLYLAEPIVAVREPMSPADIDALAAIPGRKAIWSGYGLRLSLDPDSGYAPLADYESEIVGDVFQAGTSRTYLTLPGEYIDTPNPSLSSSPMVGGVNLQSGEFRTKVTDVLIEGRHQDLMLTRNYESRSRYAGPFGRGWDFNWNMRVFEIPADYPLGLCLEYYGDAVLNKVAQAGDALLIDGDGSVRYYARIDPADTTGLIDRYRDDPAIPAFGWSGRIQNFYASPDGDFAVLHKFIDGSWVVVSPNGVRTHFLANGKLDRVIGVYEASELICRYRPNGWLDRIIGDRGVSLFIGRYVDASVLDTRSYDLTNADRIEVGLISRIQLETPTGRTEICRYLYDDAGNLVQVEERTGGVILNSYGYGYDVATPHQLTSLGRAGLGWPSQSLTYTDGLVFSLEQDGKLTTFGGAVPTAEVRYGSGNSTVTASTGGQTAEFTIDNRGRPTEFANQQFSADDAGRLTLVSDADTSSEITYDIDNPVHRFRGNIIGTTQVGRSSFQTSIDYDQSAWNRVTNRVSTEGIQTSIAYSGPGTSVDEIVETSGPVLRRQVFNEYGQMEVEELMEADHTLRTTYEYDVSSHLLSAVVRGDAIRADLSRDSDEAASSLTQGTASYDVVFNSDSQPERLSTAEPIPSLALGYNRGLIETEELAGSSGDVIHTYTYDPAEKTRLESVESSEAGLQDLITEYGYDGQGRLKTLERGDETTQYTYDGVLLTGVRGPGVSRAVTFSGSLPTSVVEQGVTNLLSYDAEDRLESTESQGLITSFTYNLGHQVQDKTLRDESGTLLQEAYSYDQAGRLEEITSSAGDREFGYFADGAVRSMSIGGTVVRELERDEAGRVTQLTLPRQVEVQYTYTDGTKQPIEEVVRYYPSSGAGITTIQLDKGYGYDSAGRMESMTLPVGTWSFGYDSFGYLTARTDPDGVSVEQIYSPSGALLRTVFEDGFEAQYTYDTGRRLERVGAMDFLLDADEKLIEEIRYPDGTYTRYLARNEFLEPDQINHNGLMHDLTWEDGRLIEIRASEVLSYTYDGLGRKTRVSLSAQETLFDYDARGHLVNVTNRVGGLTGTRYVWSVSYDNLGRLATETYPSGLSVDWSPGFNGMPTAALSAGVTSIEWQGPGLIAAVVYEGGLRAVHRYNSGMQKDSISYETGDPRAPDRQAGFDYELTSAGRILRESRFHEDRTDVYDRAPADEGMRILGFSLSATNNLGEGAEVAVRDFTFDINGEITSPMHAAGADARALMPATTTLNHRVMTADGVPVTYNAQGAVSQTPVWVRLPGHTQLTREIAHLDYDDFGMVQRVTRGVGADLVTVTYTRDGLGRIVQRDVAGDPTRCRPGSWQYAWRGQQLIEEYEQDSGLYELVRRYVYTGPYLILLQAAPVPGDPLVDYVPLANINGSICGYASPSGEILEMILYGPYGTPVTRQDQGVGDYLELERSDIGFTLLFQGAMYDGETGLYQMGQRNLHPQLGRFLQRDNLLYVDSRALFTAFNGDPVGKIDPSGALVQTFEAMQGTWKDVKAFGGASQAFAKAWNATVSHQSRKESDLGVAGIDLLTSGLQLASSVGGEDFQQMAGNVSAAAENLKTGIEALQIGLDMRRDKLLLTAIKAHAMAPAHYSPRMKWLSVGGANAGYDLLDADFFADESYQKARSFRAGSGSATAYYLDQKKAYYNKRQGNLLSLTKKGHSLAGKYLAYAFKDDSAPGVQTSRYLMEGSGALLDLAGEFHKVAGDKDLSAMTFSVGRGARIASARNLYKARSHLQLSFHVGVKLGQIGVMAVSDEYTATAYKAAVKKFNDNGGFLTVFSGILTCANNDTLNDVAWAIQRYADFNMMNYLNVQATQLDRRTQFYLQGIDAP